MDLSQHGLDRTLQPFLMVKMMLTIGSQATGMSRKVATKQMLLH
jgi:hypothetical protein